MRGRAREGGEPKVKPTKRNGKNATKKSVKPTCGTTDAQKAEDRREKTIDGTTGAQKDADPKRNDESMLLQMKLEPPKAVTPLPREGRGEATTLALGVSAVSAACLQKAQVLKTCSERQIGSKLLSYKQA